jgi:hypothetical protein
LGDARRNVNAYGLHNDLANEVPLRFSIPVFRRQTCLKDDINCSTNVYFVYLSVDRHANMLLLSMEQHGERGRSRSRVGRTKFPRCDAVVCTVLREKGRKIMIDERTKIHREYPVLDSAEDGRKDARKFNEELFVIACNPCPPWVNVRTEGECYKIIELSIQGWIGRGCLEKRRCRRGRREMGK